MANAFQMMMTSDPMGSTAAKPASTPLVPSVKINAGMTPISHAKPSVQAAPVARVGDCPSDYLDLYEQWEDDDTKKMPTPNTLRGQIRKFLATTGCKITAFQKIIDVNGNSYNKYMNGKYKDQWSATANSTYRSAAYFFWREKKLGKKNLATQWSASQPAKTALPDVSDVQLGSNDIYLTPQEVRKELSSLMSTYACTQGSIAKAVGAVNANAMSRFMSAGGEFGGRDMDFYDLAALYLEKLRVKLNKPKSKKRKAIEAEVAQNPGKRPFLGVDTSQKVWCFAGAVPCKGKDELGRTVLQFR